MNKSKDGDAFSEVEHEHELRLCMFTSVTTGSANETRQQDSAAKRPNTAR